MEKIGIGLIGTGSRGKRHLERLIAMEDVKVVGVADPYEPNLREAVDMAGGDLRAFEDYRKLLELKDLEGVVIAAPQYLHAQIATDAFSAGKHVLCEKPMATTVADCRQMIKASKEAGKVLQVGLQLRFHPKMVGIHRAIEEGQIGQVKMMWYNNFRPPFLKKVGDFILQQRLSGGVLTEKNCHHFDLFEWFIGSPATWVMASGGQDWEYREGGKYASMKDPDTQVDIVDNAWVIVDYENGARACLGLCLFCYYGGDPNFMGVIGTAGRIDGNQHGATLWNEAHPDGVALEVGDWDATEAELRHFLECIREDKEPLVDGEKGLRSVAVALAAEKSIKEGRRVAVSEVMSATDG